MQSPRRTGKVHPRRSGDYFGRIREVVAWLIRNRDRIYVSIVRIVQPVF